MPFVLQQTCVLFRCNQRNAFPFLCQPKKSRCSLVNVSNASSKIPHYVMFVEPCHQLLRNSAGLPTASACIVFKIESVNKQDTQANTAASLLVLVNWSERFSYTNSPSSNLDPDLLNTRVSLKLDGVNASGTKQIVKCMNDNRRGLDW
jgi:hypothetical protein